MQAALPPEKALRLNSPTSASNPLHSCGDHLIVECAHSASGGGIDPDRRADHLAVGFLQDGANVLDISAITNIHCLESPLACDRSTKEALADIRFGVTRGIDMVALSLVRRPTMCVACGSR